MIFSVVTDAAASVGDDGGSSRCGCVSNCGNWGCQNCSGKSSDAGDWSEKL